MVVDKDLFKVGRQKINLSEYSTEEIKEELGRRESQAKEEFTKVVHKLYDFGFTHEGIKELLNDI